MLALRTATNPRRQSTARQLLPSKPRPGEQPFGRGLPWVPSNPSRADAGQRGSMGAVYAWLQSCSVLKHKHLAKTQRGRRTPYGLALPHWSLELGFGLSRTAPAYRRRWRLRAA